MKRRDYLKGVAIVPVVGIVHKLLPVEEDDSIDNIIEAIDTMDAAEIPNLAEMEGSLMLNEFWSKKLLEEFHKKTVFGAVA